MATKKEAVAVDRHAPEDERVVEENAQANAEAPEGTKYAAKLNEGYDAAVIGDRLVREGQPVTEAEIDALSDFKVEGRRVLTKGKEL